MIKLLKRVWCLVWDILTLPLILVLTLVWFLLGLASIVAGLTFKEWCAETGALPMIKTYKDHWKYIFYGIEIEEEA